MGEPGTKELLSLEELEAAGGLPGGGAGVVGSGRSAGGARELAVGWRGGCVAAAGAGWGGGARASCVAAAAGYGASPAVALDGAGRRLTGTGGPATRSGTGPG